MADETRAGLPVLPFLSAEAWEEWLATSPGSEGVWLRIAKRGSGIATVTYDEAVDVALCFGWIDGQKAGYDASWFLQRFTPRRARSRWSEVNVARVERLVADGRMRPAGLAEVERAKADRRWDAAYGQRAFTEVPADLQDALDAEPGAAEFFATLNAANRYAVLYRVHDAKRPETRARRIAQLTEMLAAGKKIH